MKKTASLFLLIGMLVIVKPLFAFPDICEMGAKAQPMTTLQMQEFHNKKIRPWRIKGSGLLYDIRDGSFSATCTITLYCGNDVVIKIENVDYSAKLKKKKIGDKITFSGKCYKLKREYYQDSDKEHIIAYITDAIIKINY